MAEPRVHSGAPEILISLPHARLHKSFGYFHPCLSPVINQKDRTMSRRRLSFTERRRARLARKSAQLDRLETRNTITEPISFTGLALSSMRGLAQLGIMQADGGNSALLGLTQMAQQAKLGLAPPRPAPAPPHSPTALTIAFPPSARRPRRGVAGPRRHLRTRRRRQPAACPSIGWRRLDRRALPRRSPTVSARPWQPAARAGGGAALPPRGGSGSGAQAATVALVSGRGGHAQAQPSSSAPATIPGYMAGQPYQAVPANQRPARAATGNAASGPVGQGAASPPSSRVTTDADDAGTSSGPVTIAENPSSVPSSSAGNGSGFSQDSFPYFTLFVLDANNGITLFNGQSQQASLDGVVNLDAQVSGTTVSTYSWTTSGLSLTSSSGASTYAFQFQLVGALTSPEVGSVTLTVTNTSSQQESETFYFVVPTTNVVDMPTSSDWPTTISPDLVEPGAPSIASDGVSVDADSGASTPTSTCPAITRPSPPCH